MKTDSIMLDVASSPEALVRAAMSRQPGARRTVARALMAMDAKPWYESKCKRDKGGRFSSNGGGGYAVAREATNPPGSLTPGDLPDTMTLPDIDIILVSAGALRDRKRRPAKGHLRQGLNDGAGWKADQPGRTLIITHKTTALQGRNRGGGIA